MYVAETFQRRKKGEEWPLEMERNIDRNGSAKPRAARAKSVGRPSMLFMFFMLFMLFMFFRPQYFRCTFAEK
jgi:hypothetical protein